MSEFPTPTKEELIERSKKIALFADGTPVEIFTMLRRGWSESEILLELGNVG
jgi:hypothetical protein